ncbi:probable ADP-ribosylation factor GTPase-activating protein AGD14 isoform X3 [Macadamia integrifolia]|uniref:probable ADP-ribosylation factor GTPase-activating protein AGD14 isoform X3 n=1 Tax=Macadamia integrifolia TaxID=60698 RepID=UPI001C4F78B3|nr:probable ADP-ribosylation factor GTPase-activating protein AGD14 isoform X3 [Macadamia integrifolia]
MSSRKEEERNEKIIRGLMKLPPNRRCINCNSLGPQYVCPNFWTFVCVTCSGIHREFTHRVKSVSMAKFTSQEVEALQKGGNQRAREIYLKDWDLQRQRLPDSSNVDKIREFIKNVYVDCKYAGGKTSDKPPRNMQNVGNNEDDTRRASSYHSYSQSPPYEYQYEERRYGRQAGALTRKPGSDRALYERKISSFIYSPGRYEDRIAIENSGSRISDYSVSSGGDPFRSDTQSPNFQKNVGFGSPPIQPVRDILNEDVQRQTISSYSETNVRREVDGIPRPQRATSSGSFGSFDSNSMSSKSVNSDLFQQPAPSSAPPIDLFGSSQTSSALSLDLFANIAHQQPATNILEQKQSGFPIAENEGWATFDSPNQVTSTLGTNNVDRSTRAHADGLPVVRFNALASTNTSGKLQSVQSSATHGSVPLASSEWHGAVQDVQASTDLGSNQSWNAFEDLGETVSQSSFESLPPRTEPHVQASTGPISTQSWNAFQDSAGSISQTSFGNPPQRIERQAQAFSGPISTQQPWNAFEDSADSLSLASFENLPQRNEPQLLAHNPPATIDQCLSSNVQEEPNKDGFQRAIMEERTPIPSVPVNGALVASSLAPLMRIRVPRTGIGSLRAHNKVVNSKFKE